MSKVLIIACTFWFTVASHQNDFLISNQSQINTTMNQKDKKEIESLLESYKNSLNSSDANLATSLYSKEGLFMPSEAPTARGHEQILKSYQFIFTQIQLKIEFYIDEISIEGNLAFATTSSKGTILIHATGDTVSEANRELFVFEKIQNEWKIARYMFNKTQAK